MIARRKLVTVIAALIVGAATPVLAQSYPSRVIKLVVPFTPGSPNDVMARLLTQHLSPRLGQPIVIENLIQPKIDYLCGLERQTRTDPKALPRTTTHEGLGWIKEMNA